MGDQEGVPKHIGQGRFSLEKKLGEGSFGAVYSALDSSTDLQVAVKLEHKQGAANGQLTNEARLLELLARPSQRQGYTEVLFFGKEGSYSILVMDLLGLTLEQSLQACPGRVFSPGTALMVAEQAIRLLAYLHSKTIVHRDIKSENFMWGRRGRLHHLHIIDFGMGSRYWLKKHVRMTQGNQLTGTARYASINAMRGCSQSRRDDLEALGHMLIYSLRGSLPWSGLDAKSYADKLRLICERKATIPLDDLCRGYPVEFETFLRYSRQLGFEARPDYDNLLAYFGRLRSKLAPPLEDHHLPWLPAETDPRSLEPLLREPCPPQPEAFAFDAETNHAGCAAELSHALKDGEHQLPLHSAAKAKRLVATE